MPRSEHFDWFSRDKTNKRQRNRKRISKGGWKPKSETLEDRRLLAGVTVGNALDLINGDTTSIAALTANGGDGGDGISLREAIAAANNTTGADQVSFDSSLSGSVITLGGPNWRLVKR